MRLNISMLKDYLKCPQLAYYLHVNKRGPIKHAVPLDVGTLFHESAVFRWRGEQVAMVYKVPGGPSDERLFATDGAAMPQSWDIVSPEAQDQWIKHKLWLPLNAWSPDPAWEVIAVEDALEAPVNQPPMVGPTLQGRLDGIVKWNGKFWSAQWKTYEDDLLGLQERVRLSYHEVAYQYLAEQNGYTPWGGTILGACQKLPSYRIINGKRQEVTDEMRCAALTQHYLFRSPSTQTSMLWHTQAELAGADISMRLGIPLRNYDSCFGPFGRGRCPFFSVCHEGGSLDDDTKFTDLADRYAEVPPDAL